MACRHCGSEHAPGTATCPKTGERTDAPGPIGTRIDRYEVLKLLGSGGFGSVYRARHVHTDAEVALKVLKRQLNADQAMLDRFLREAKAAAAVGSDHIVRVLDAGVSQDGTGFLAMELLDGWDLKELITREGPQNPRRLVAIILQVLDGLQAAHAKGIVHRDMKPANVFVTRRTGDDGDERDFVKLLDFGISKMHQAGDVAGLTMTGIAMGTPSYMAPEQFFDARSVDGRADLYSVAAMLYELLGNRLPFEAQSYADLIVKVKTETPPPLSTVQPQLPAALCAAVDRGLSREKDTRWTTAKELSTALRQGLGLPLTGSGASLSSAVTAALPPAGRPEDTGAPRVAPHEASLMFGATSMPSPAPAPASAPTPATAPLQAGSGWVGTPRPSGPTRQPAPPLQPVAMPGQAPLRTAPAPQPPGQKSSTGKIVLIVSLSLGAALLLCCIMSAIANNLNQG